jgi:lysophospholipase L1-like esterase
MSGQGDLTMLPFVHALRRGDAATLSALGDSLTYGYLVARGYLDMVEETLQRLFPEALLTVHNHGVCGDTVFDGLERAGEAFFAPQPQVGLIQFGLNDCFQGMSAARFSAGLEHLVLDCRQRVPHMDLVLVPPPPVEAASFDQAAEPFREAMADVAEEHGGVLAPVSTRWNEDRPDEPLWLADGVHPTQAGYRRMASAVLDALGVTPLLTTD